MQRSKIVIRTAALLTFFLPLFLAASLAFARPSSASPDTSKGGDIHEAAEFQKVPCGAFLSLAVPQQWESSSVSFDAVQCAFKNPASGFPNVNVVVEPSSRADGLLANAQKIQRVVDSYRGIGLTDAALAAEIPFMVQGAEGAFAAELHHTGERAPMVAVVGVFYVGDRRFILTFLDVKDAFKVSKGDAFSVLRSVSLTERGLALGNTASSPPPLSEQRVLESSTPNQTHDSRLFTPISLGIGGALILLALASLLRQRRQ